MADSEVTMPKERGVLRTAIRAVVIVGLCLIALVGGAPACLEEPAKEGHEVLRIAGQRFELELAIDHQKRIKGLGERESIPEDGGMLFVFPQPMVLVFVMRDCTFDIDVAFLDDAGRVVAVHAMKVEEPQREGESDTDYELRLRRYSSRYAARFAVEVRGGTLGKLGVKVGDLIKMDVEGLKRRVK